MSAAKPRLRKIAPIASLVLVALAIGSSIAYAFFGLGLRAYVVETPSMGTYAPVGTLVISAPAADKQIKVGQAVLFQPENNAKTYFHRIVKATPNGFSTAGDLTHEVDPWLVQGEHVIGVEIFHGVNLGWVFKASPILALGIVLLIIYLRFFSTKFWRVPSALFGFSAVVSVANYVLHPFVQATLLDKSTANGIATIRFVNTGILPLDVKANGVTHLVAQGELFVSHSKIAAKGTYSVSSVAHVEWWVLALFIAVLLIPTLVGFGYSIYAHVKGEDWYYAPVKGDKIPENLLVNQSDQITLDGKVYPKYITEDYEAQPYWLEGVENLSTEELAQRILVAR